MDEGWLKLNARGRMRGGPFLKAFLLYQFWNVLGAVAAVAAPLFAAVLLPMAAYGSICVQSKRLHDLGLSGWLQIAASVPFLAYAVFLDWWSRTPGDYGAVETTLLLAAVAAYVGYVAWLARAKGTRGPNPYGEDPDLRPYGLRPAPFARL